MTRRRPLLAAALAALLLSACGSSGGVARASAPPLPDTTAPPTATPSPSPSPTAQPTPTPSPTPTATVPPVEGGVIRVPPDDSSGDATVAADLYPSSGSATCPSSGSAGYGACPVTPRLADRLNQHPIHGVEQLCRCGNPWQSVGIRAPTVLPAVDSYTVEVDLTVNGNPIQLDVLVLRTADGWFADDIRCHGGSASTSIHAPSPPLC